MGIVRDLYYARKISAGLKLPAPTVALLIKRLRLAAAMGGGGIEKTVSGSPTHITDALAKAALSVLVNITPIQPGSGDPSPSNIRPISGITGLSVYRTGKNLLPNLRNIGPNRVALGQTEEYGTLMINLAAGTYTLSITHTSTVNWRVYERHNNTNTVLGRLTPGGGTDSFTFTVAADTNYSFSVYDTNGVDSDAITQFWLEIGSTSTSYEPYNGNTYAVDWSAQAGTVYHGTVDVVTGVLTVDTVKLKISDLTWDYTSDCFRSASIMGSGITGNVVTCDSYAVANQTTPTADRADMTINFGASGSAARRIYIKDSRYDSTTISAWQTAMGDTEIVRELANPLTYQLTAQEVQMLLGENYVWSSSGDTVSVTYYAEGNANTLQSLNILLGGNYSNPKTADDVSDKEALEIILGGNK